MEVVPDIVSFSSKKHVLAPESQVKVG